MASPSEHRDIPSAADLWGDGKPSAPLVDDEDWICEFCDAENPSCYPLTCSWCHVPRNA